jgi:hypothetical protein
MPISTNKYKWRDRIVLLICWGVVFFTAVANWASDGLPTEGVIDPVQSRWQVIEPYIFTILPLVILVVPLLILLISRAFPDRSFTKARMRFHRPEVFWGLVFLFNIGQALLLFEDYRNDLLLEFVFILLVAGITLWLFYGREEIDLRKIIFVVILWIGIFFIRQTIPILQENISFPSASWYTKIYVLLMVLFFISSISLPLLVLFDRNQKITSRMQELFRKIPVGIWAVIFILASLWTFAFFWTMENEVIGVMAMRLGAVAIDLSAGGMLLWVFGGESRPNAGEVLPIGKTWYVILLGLLLVAYVILAFRVGTNNLENINPDGLSYLDIAREYAKGNPVVNGLWSPLLSWLIAPAISIGVDPHVSYQALEGLAGAIWIWLSVLLAKRAGISPVGRLVFAASMIIIMLSFGFGQTTPDILGAVFIALYFYWLTHPAYLKHPFRFGIAIGITGALAYYAKYYNLPFVLAHIPLTAALYLLHKKRSRAVVLRGLTSILVVLVSVTPWIVALWHRYGMITISTSGPINMAVMAPGSTGHPCWENQLCDQPDDVLAPWEDPLPKDYAAYGWSPFQSIEDLRHQISFMKNNLWTRVSDTLFVLGPFLPLSLLAAGIAVFIFWSDSVRRLRYSWIILTVLLYASGYVFTSISSFRYYYSILPLVLIAGYSLVQIAFNRIAERAANGRKKVNHLLIGAVLVMTIFGLGQIDMIGYFLANPHGTCLKEGAEDIKEYLKAPIAGTDISINYIAYYTGIRTLGVIAPEHTAEDADKLLHDFGVDTFIAKSGSYLETGLVNQFNFHIVKSSEICGEGYSILKVP